MVEQRSCKPPVASSILAPGLATETSDSHADLIALAVEVLRYRYDVVATEFSPYRPSVAGHYVVFDFIALSRHNREIRIIECKASRADFLADKKWQRYVPYCTHLAFLGPPAAFSKDELPKDIGVIRPRWVKAPRPHWAKEESWSPEPKFEWYYERGCRPLQQVGDREYLAILQGFVGCYSRCLWTCRHLNEKREGKFGEER